MTPRWCVFPVQGRPGPKGDVGDGGLPGQKVGAALVQTCSSPQFLNFCLFALKANQTEFLNAAPDSGA